MDRQHVRKRVQDTESDGSVHVGNEDSFAMHAWMEDYRACFRPEVWVRLKNLPNAKLLPIR